MSETKRGAPTEDGTYIVLLHSGTQLVVRKHGTNYTYTDGGYCDLKHCTITAHRRHEPLVVPELRELERVKATPVVVKIRTTGHVFYAERYGVAYSVHSGRGLCWSYKASELTELTRAECEDAGFKWPLAE